MTVRDIRGMSDDFVVFEVGISSKAKKSSKRTPPCCSLSLFTVFFYALLNFSFPCLHRGHFQSSGRSSNARPSCSAGSYT